MNAPQVRGYCILRALSFVEEHFGTQAGRQLKDGLSPQLHAIAAHLTANEWCPRECYVELMTAIARERADAEDDLIRCGESMAVEAHDTFLRLVMGVLTPSLFAKKLPAMWEINHRGSGRIEVDLADVASGHVKARLVGVAGFDHVALAYLGWIRRGLARVGKPGARVEQQGWSAATPGPDVVTYEIAWS